VPVASARFGRQNPQHGQRGQASCHGAQCCLTPRSTRDPPRLAAWPDRPGVSVGPSGQAASRSGRVSSNVRRRRDAPTYCAPRRQPAGECHRANAGKQRPCHGRRRLLDLSGGCAKVDPADRAACLVAALSRAHLAASWQVCWPSTSRANSETCLGLPHMTHLLNETVTTKSLRAVGTSAYRQNT